jgi:hypothetical protein
MDLLTLRFIFKIIFPYFRDLRDIALSKFIRKISLNTSLPMPKLVK